MRPIPPKRHTGANGHVTEEDRLGEERRILEVGERLRPATDPLNPFILHALIPFAIPGESWCGIFVAGEAVAGQQDPVLAELRRLIQYSLVADY